MQKITIILQASTIKKRKYVRNMLCQMHILNTITANLVLKNAFIANALVKFCDLLFTFYEIYLFLEHQNKKFNRFQANQGSLL